MGAKQRLLQFIHLPAFDEDAERLLLDDDDLRLLQKTLNDNPRAGVVVQGTDGVRKLRIAGSGRGKRGGGRLLYLYVELRGLIYLISLFAKNEQPDFTPTAYREIRMLVRQLKREQ